MKGIFAYSSFLMLAGVLLLGGCIEKFDLHTLPDAGTVSVIGDTNYVEILPPFGGFTSPRGMVVGNDQLIYVTDYGQNSLIMLDAGGRILKTRSILHPMVVAQNSKLDLYVGGETIAPNGRDTLGAVYRIYLVRFDTTYVSRIDTFINSSTGDTTITPVVRDTSYFSYHDLENAPMRVVWSEPARPGRRFTGIGMFPTNDYLVTRTGPDNSSFVDPDSRVMYFSNNDVFVTPIPDLVTRPSGGTGITDIRNLTSILVFPSSRDFILTQSSEGVSYGALWMIYNNTKDFQGWLPKFDPSNPDQRGVDFIRQGRFVNPSGIAYDKRRREVFIVDAALDSVVKFDRAGAFRTESFGKFKTRSADFPGLSSPGGIAFSNDCTLFIVDTGNRIVRRFKLSTQTQCN
jgi:hypothetical protein